jgi:hypothetical protein
MIGLTKSNENALIERLEAMPFEKAREAILKQETGCKIGSPDHDLSLSWLSLKDAELRDAREESTQRWARHAAYAAYAAAIIAAISIIITIL